MVWDSNEGPMMEMGWVMVSIPPDLATTRRLNCRAGCREARQSSAGTPVVNDGRCRPDSCSPRVTRPAAGGNLHRSRRCSRQDRLLHRVRSLARSLLRPVYTSRKLVASLPDKSHMSPRAAPTKKTSAGPSRRLSATKLSEMIDEAAVDAYDGSEQASG
jgi:hypothetical protein